MRTVLLIPHPFGLIPDVARQFGDGDKDVSLRSETANQVGQHLHGLWNPVMTEQNAACCRTGQQALFNHVGRGIQKNPSRWRSTERA